MHDDDSQRQLLPSFPTHAPTLCFCFLLLCLFLLWLAGPAGLDRMDPMGPNWRGTGMELAWHGIGVEGIGVEWNWRGIGMERSGAEWSGMEWNGLDRLHRLDWLDRTGLD